MLSDHSSLPVFPLRLCSLLALLLAPSAHAAGLPACPKNSHPQGASPPNGFEWKCVDADNVANGPWLNWYANGQLMSERHMKQGREHGRQRSWWPNGQLMMEGVSVEGHRYQGFKYWSATGEPTQLTIAPEGNDR